MSHFVFGQSTIPLNAVPDFTGIDQLHYEVDAVGALVNFFERNNIVMTQAAVDVNFVIHYLQMTLVLFYQLRVYNLDGESFTVRLTPGNVDGREATAADLLLNRVVSLDVSQNA